MAKIHITLEELMHLLAENEQIHSEITDLRTENDTVNFNFQTNLPFIKSIPASARFIEFKDNTITLQLHIPHIKGKALETVARYLGSAFKSRIPEEISLDFPLIYINVKKALAKNIKGLKIDHITAEDGHFTIITSKQQ